MKIIKFLFFVVCIYAVSISRNTGTIIDITILHTNNTNGHLVPCGCPGDPAGGFPRRMTVIKKTKGPILLLDSGDVFSPMKDKKIKSAIQEILKKFPYDAIGIGDQEIINEVDFNKKYVSCNIRYKGKTIGVPYIIKEIKGIKVGIFSAISEDVFRHAFRFYPGLRDKIRILEPLKAIRSNLKKIKKKANFIIFLSHLGHEFNKEVAKKFKDIDLIIGGHSQILLEQPEKIGKTLIVSAGRNAENVGKITLSLDKKFKVVKYQYKLIRLDSKIKDDKEILRLAKKYESKINMPEFIDSQIEESSESCMKCHKRQYKQWKKTRHSRAFKTLKKKKKEFECVRCHATFIFHRRKALKNVECLACHRTTFGHRYEHRFMKSIGRFICMRCHNKERSPNFDFEKYYKKIKH